MEIFIYIQPFLWPCLHGETKEKGGCQENCSSKKKQKKKLQKYSHVRRNARKYLLQAWCGAVVLRPIGERRRAWQIYRSSISRT